MFQTDPLLRRAQAAAERLDKAVRGSNPFESIQAQREAEGVLGELKKTIGDDRAIENFRAAQGTPRPLFAERPGTAASLMQSTNAGSTPKGSRVPVMPSGGSISAPGTYPQSGNYERPDGSDPFATERRYAETPPKPESGIPVDVERQLAHWKLRGRVDPPKNYDEGERRTLGQIRQAMPDGSLPISSEMDLPPALVEWRNSGKSEAGKEHIRTRARALGVEAMLPKEFRSDKYARIGALRKN